MLIRVVEIRSYAVYDSLMCKNFTHNVQGEFDSKNTILGIARDTNNMTLCSANTQLLMPLVILSCLCILVQLKYSILYGTTLFIVYTITMLLPYFY